MLSSTVQQAPEIVIARQPIYDVSLNTYAYELLYRSSDENVATIVDGDHATSRVIVSAFMELGLDALVGEKLAFINFTQGFLCGKYEIPFSREKVVLEVLENVDINSSLINNVKELRKQGYLIALDDFEFEESKTELIELSHIIKIDVKQIGLEKLPDVVRQIAPFGKILLAEKVETEEEFEFCKGLGFKYFQGYFLSKPIVVKHKTLAPNNTLLLQILAKTQDPVVEFGELEELISRDVGISYKLLRLINSAQYNLSTQVESLHQALVLLGMKEIKTWVSIVALSNTEDSTPQELTVMSMTRAKMCQLLAEKTQYKSSDVFFTAGMFSLLDILMKNPLQDLLNALPFSDEFNKALLEHKGPMGVALDCTIAQEQGDWNQVKFENLALADINEIYVDALKWGREVCKQLD